MKKKTTAQPLADAAAKFIAANTPAPRADGKPHRKAPVKKSKRPAKRTAGSKGKKATVKAASKRAAKSVTGTLRLPKVGEKLTRAYRGKEHVVEVIDGGFKYQGETFTSLTALAKTITGYKAISGPAFFGIWKRAAAKEA